MKFLESLYGLSLKQRAALNTVKFITGFLCIVSIFVLLLMTFGWNILIWATLALSFYFVIKTLYEHNLFKLEHDIRTKELEQMMNAQVKEPPKTSKKV